MAKLIVPALALLVVLVPAAPASAGFSYSDVYFTSVTGPEGPIPKGQAATYNAVVTNGGNAPAESFETVGFYTVRVNGERPVPNPFLSVTQTGPGSCTIERTPSSFGDYHSATCAVAGLAPGDTIDFTVTVEVNESMDFQADGRELTTIVDSPPVFAGSKKIKLAGLPDGCVSNDFTLKATAKGAEKVLAKMRGPFNAEGKPEAGETTKRFLNERVDGSKLTAKIDVGKIPATLELGGAAYYELKVNAKYDGKSPQFATVLFQRC